MIAGPSSLSCYCLCLSGLLQLTDISHFEEQSL